MSEQPSTPVVEHPQKGHYQDPSPLTIQMVQREIAQLQELYISELEGLRREIITRLDAMDKALTKVEQYPTAVDTAIARVREYMDEKFRNVESRFNERDKRFDLRDQGNRELISAQRFASDAAVAKAEASVAKQLEVTDRQIRDLKERMDKEEGKTAGAIALWGIIVAVVMVAGALAGITTVMLTAEGG